MGSLRHISSLSLFLLLIAMLGRPASSLAQSGRAGQILRLVNQVRAEHALPAYRYNAALSAAAQRHADWMATNVIYSHTGAGGSRPQDRANAAGYNGYVAENIVGGTGMTPQQGVIWWRNSSLHYRMMVSARYVEAGVGFATNGSHNMYVLVMGRPAGSNAVAPPAAEPEAEPLIITPIQLAEPRGDGSIVHTVEEGQALWQIAAHYEVKLDELLWINNLDEESVIQPGDEVWIRLAEGQPPPPTPTPPLAHMVREGDNAWIIAVRYDVPLDTIFYLNSITEETMLQPGQEVRVRLADGETPPPTPTPPLTHVIEQGETLWTVAAINGLSIEELLAYNGISEDAILQPGDELWIVEPPTPTAQPSATPPAPQATVDGSQASSAGASANTPSALPPQPVGTASPTPTTVAEAPSEPTPAMMTNSVSGNLLPQSDVLYIGSLFLAGLGLAVLAGLAFRGQSWP